MAKRKIKVPKSKSPPKKRKTVNINEEETNQDLARCIVWLKQQKKEKYKVPAFLDHLSSDVSDDDDLAEMRLNRPASSSSADSKGNEKPDPNRTADKNKTDTKLYFACEWQKCSRLFDTYIDLQQHVHHHLDSINFNEDDDINSAENYECDWDLCDYETNNKKAFRRHVLYHVYHTNVKTLGEQLLLKKDPLPACMNDSRRRNIIPATESDYVCMWRECKFKFDLIQEYYEHSHNHCIHELSLSKVKNRNRKVQCQWIDCKKEFDRRLKMIDHMRTHTSERILACSNCGSTFNSYTKFYDHYRRQAISTNFKCNQCFHSFATEELLNNHMYSHINCIKCTMCDMTCPSPSALSQHFRYRHLTEKPFKCKECDYGAVTKSDLHKHILNRHDPVGTTFYCEEFDCDFSCNKMAAMRKHERNEHGNGPNIYCCHCCNKRYSFGWSLSKHLIKNHGFQLPSGHKRFTYRQDIDGFYRVQTTRIESLEVSEQFMHKSSAPTSENILYEMTEIKKDDIGFTINLRERKPSKRDKGKTDEEESITAELVNMEYETNRVTDNVLDVHGENDDDDIGNYENSSDDGDSVDSCQEYDKSSGKVLENIPDYVVEEAVDSCDMLRSGNSRDVSVNSEQIIGHRYKIENDDDSHNAQEAGTNTNSTDVIDVISIAGGSVESNTRPKHKNINDFSVMKKYLQNNAQTNEILITFDEIDECGNVIHSKTRKATEIEVNNLKDTDSSSENE